MTVGTPENLKRNIMSKLYNLGCSFAYGNCAPRRNKLCNEHKGPGTYIAKYLDRKEEQQERKQNSTKVRLKAQLKKHFFDLLHFE